MRGYMGKILAVTPHALMLIALRHFRIVAAIYHAKRHTHRERDLPKLSGKRNGAQRPMPKLYRETTKLLVTGKLNGRGREHALVGGPSGSGQLNPATIGFSRRDKAHL
jgi:hypothetical protein